MKIDGKQIAQTLYDELAKKVAVLKEQGTTPRLDIILIGENPASVAYVKQKELNAEKIGATTHVHRLPATITNEEIKKLVEKINDDPSIHGCIIQRPVPSHITLDIASLVKSEKDVDGFHKETTFRPPIALAVWEIIKAVYKTLPPMTATLTDWVKSQTVVIMGKGEAGGKPIREFLEEKGIKPQIIDSKTTNPNTIARSADILIPSIGKHVVTKNMIKPGVFLIGVGMYRGEDDKLHPDYEVSDIESIAGFYTPVPGGVGPVNVATLLSNLVIATENQTR